MVAWPLMCLDCVHWGEWNDRGNPTCAAFPFGIPVAVSYGSIDHRRPVIGDRGIQFEPDPESGYDEDRWKLFHQKLDERAARIAERAARENYDREIISLDDYRR